MKNRVLLMVVLAIFALVTTMHAQTDPLSRFVKQRNLAGIEQSLTSFGKAQFDKDRGELSKRTNLTFKIEPNAVLNRPDNVLNGTLEADFSESNRQLLFTQNKTVLAEMQRDFSVRKLTINPNLLIDFSTIDWKKILMGASGCTINTSLLTPVKDQGGCGSCWAFAAAAAWEHTYRKLYGTATVPDVSEEELVNCGKTCSGDDAGSCSGGHSWKAMDYIKCFQVARESAYPYTGTDASCRSAAKSYGAYGWLEIGSGYPSNDMVKAAINTYGAVVTYLFAKGWGSYGTGVMNAYPNGDPALVTSKGGTINHAVTIVGWCDAKNAWIIKNSWGTDWGGYGGYAYIAYNHYNINNRVYAVCPRP